MCRDIYHHRTGHLGQHKLDQQKIQRSGAESLLYKPDSGGCKLPGALPYIDRPFKKWAKWNFSVKLSFLS